jgi:hypothetical protein
VLVAAAEFIFEGEGGSPKHPYWPKGESGVTWGVGWDASQQTLQSLQSEWGQLLRADLEALKITVPETPGTRKDKAGFNAKPLLEKVKHILIPAELALRVFRDQTLPAYYHRAAKAFPGLNRLPLHAQVALISLVYNRGASMGREEKEMDRRWEMRRIKEAVAEADVRKIAEMLRSMKRLWKGTTIEKGMNKRRDDEAGMAEKSIQENFNPH